MITPTEGGVYLTVHVQPGAKRTAIVGIHGDSLKVTVPTPPERGKANQAVTRLIADRLGVPRGDVELVSGHSTRRKRLLIRGVTEADVTGLLDP